MKVKELIEALQGYDQDLHVVICTDCPKCSNDEYIHSEIEDVLKITYIGKEVILLSE
jgi:hypothetical protein